MKKKIEEYSLDVQCRFVLEEWNEGRATIEEVFEAMGKVLDQAEEKTNEKRRL